MKRFLIGLFLASSVAFAATGFKNSDINRDARISLSKLQLIANNSIVGNVSGGSSVPYALNQTAFTAIVNAFTGDTGSGGVKGAVPAPSALDGALGKFLFAGGTWSVPSVANGMIQADAVTNDKMANMAQATIRGRASGAGTGDPQDLTGTQAAAIVDAFTGDSGAGGVKGEVPAPSAGDSGLAKFLHSGGTWSVPPAFQADSGSGGSKGYVPAPSSGDFGAGKFLSAGATWSVPAIPLAPNATRGAVIYSTGSAWSSSVVPVPACSAISASNVDWSLGNCFTKTLSANTTFTFSNRVAGQTIILRVTNPASFTYTLPSTNTQGNSVLWAGSTIPTASTANKKDIVTIFYDGTEMYGNAVQNFGGF